MDIIKRIVQRLRYAITGQFLCDTCKNDYGNVCNRPARPNAVICSAYERLRR